MDNNLDGHLSTANRLFTSKLLSLVQLKIFQIYLHIGNIQEVIYPLFPGVPNTKVLVLRMASKISLYGPLKKV